MRVNMQKYLFVGTQNVQSLFFEKAQKIGSFEFISPSKQKGATLSKGIEDLKLAIKTLRRLPSKPQVNGAISKGRALVDQILILKREIENLYEEIRVLDVEIIKVHPLGIFDLNAIEEIKVQADRNVSFFFMRHGRMKHKDVPPDLLFLNTENDLDYFMYIGKEPFFHPGFTELVVKKSLVDLRIERKRLQDLAHEKEEELKNLAVYQEFLYDLFLQEMNRLNLSFAKGDVESYLDERLFGVEAWIPDNKLASIDEIVSGLSVYAEKCEILPGEAPPTYLENKGYSRVGQDLVEGYDMPSLTDKDPSTWVLWSFAIFFGMIISDAGYGVIFLLAAIYAWIKYPKVKGVYKRMLKLLTILSITTIIWGAMVSSYFSLIFKPNSFVNQHSMLYAIAKPKINYHVAMQDDTYHGWLHEYPKLTEAKGPLQTLETGTQEKGGRIIYSLMKEIYDSILLEFALLIGIIHISLSFIRNLYRSWAGIGWVIMMWGGFLFFPKVVDAVTLFNYFGWLSLEMSAIIGQILLYAGFGIAIVLSIIQEGFSIASFFKVIEIFADVLSYLRLYALGLASVVMAETFNEIGIVIGGYIGGIFIIIFGHSVNITLSVMAGVIHGLRLNFLEWYHHSFEGGGRKFNPLRLLTRE